MKKIVKFIGVITVICSTASCFSTYPIQKKFPCDENSTQEKLELIKDAYYSKMKPKELVLDAAGVRYKGHSYDFGDIKYVRVKTKLGPFWSYRKYWIQVRTFDGKRYEIFSTDFEIKSGNINNISFFTCFKVCLLK